MTATITSLTVNIFIFTVFTLSLILTVAFFTLMERKVLSAMQCRNGPDKAGLMGIFQPIADAIKLLVKEFIIPQSSLPLVFIISPFLVLVLSLLSWAFIPLTRIGAFSSSPYSLLWILALSSMNVYAIFIAGVSSSSKYAIIGAIRSISQMLSYEIAVVIIILPIIFTAGSTSLYDIIMAQIYFGFSNFSWMLPNAVLFYICILAETNRAPFDLPEAEAELVAGYNVEYSAFPFAFFFLGEYLNILTMSFMFVILFWSGWTWLTPNSYMLDAALLYTKAFLIAFSIVWVRATLPRVRYDSLMNFCWKYCLIMSTAYFILFISMYTLFVFLNI